MLGEDGVHLDRRWNRRAAVNLICRVVEEDVVVAVVEQGGKKLKED
jgi:hypothetical protein